MVKELKLITVLCGILFLSSTAAGVFAGEEEAMPAYGRGDLPKRISVVRTNVPPVIDGVMKPGEWNSAALITGLTQVSAIRQWGITGSRRTGATPEIYNMAGDQSYFWITYDDDNIYIAHHSPPPERLGENPAVIAVMLKKEQTIHDGNLDWDDSIHISLVDPVYPGGDKYVIQVNSIGTSFECIWNSTYVWEQELLDKNLGNVPGLTLGWNPEIQNASTLTLDGWFIELAVPWKDFQPHVKRPEPGEIKYMNFGRLWREAMPEDHAWKAHDNQSPAGEVVFMGEEGIVVHLKDTGSLPRGRALFSADIINRYSTEKNLVAEITTDSGELYDKHEIILPAGGSSEYSFDSIVSDFATTKISFTIKDTDTDDIVHITTLPVIRPTEPDIYTRRYRSLDIVQFETDMAFLGSADLRRTSMALTIKNKETGKRVFRKTYRGFTSYQRDFEISTREWMPGDYEAHFVFSAPGMPRHETTVDYYHPQLPLWWDNRYGFEDMDNDMVPYPWTHMKVEDHTISVWGRSYNLGGSFLPRQITTLDYPMLRSPIRIVVETREGEIIDTAEAYTRLEWTKTNRTRVEGTGLIDAGQVSLKNDFWAEYDGILWNTLSINPKNAVEIISMKLEIPLTREFTDVINPRDYKMIETGKLKPEGFMSEPTRAVWLGNAEGGIQWFCETDGQFFLQDVLKSLKVVVEDGAATLSVTMIDIPTNFDKPHEIEFGFIATPVRPRTWRTPEHLRYRGITGGMNWDNNYMVVPGAPNTMSGLYVGSSLMNIADDGYRLFADEWRPNHKERVSFEGAELNKVNWAPVTQASKSLRNYYAWRHWYRQHKHGYGFQSLYYDCSGAQFSANPYIGTAYTRRDGTVASTIPLLAERELTRRLYVITMSNPDVASRDSWIGYHQSGMPNMVFMGFANENWNAENYNSIINITKPTYTGVVDPAQYRADHMGHNFGWPTFFLGQGRIRREWVEANGGPEAVFDQITGLDLLHDGGGVCCVMPGGKDAILRQVRKRMTDAVSRHNLRHWKFQFMPYWKQDIVKLPDADMYASLYVARPSVLAATDPNENFGRRRVVGSYFDRHLPDGIKERNLREVELARKQLEKMNDKAVLIVYNNSEWEGEMRLEVDWDKLGLGSPDTLDAENAVHSTGFRIENSTDEEGAEFEKAVFFHRPEEYAKIESGKLVFPMTRHNYRMIVLEKKD